MKIHSITTINFLGARAVEIKLSKPVALFCGKNGSGKSSIQESIRMALTGETVRVNLKKDYAALISEGQESGFAAIETGTAGFETVLPSGKGNHSDNAALPYVLDAQRFASLDDNERRSFLFGLMGVKMDGATVKDRLIVRGCDAAKVERVLPILRAGFDAANKEASAKARDAKASYKTATGGETWGKEKGGKWQPAALPEGAEDAAAKHEQAKQEIASINAELSIAQQALGAAKASDKQRAEAMQKRAGIEAIAANVERYTTKLNLDQAELTAWEQKVADCKALAGVGQPNPKAPGEYLLRGLASVTHGFLSITCDFPDVEWPSELINRAAAHHAEYVKLHGDESEVESKPDQEAVAKLPEYENALRLMQSSVANATRNLEAAKTAVDQLKVLDGMTEAADIEGPQAKVNELTAKLRSAQEIAEVYRDIADKFSRRKALIDQVAKLHADVLAWTDIADALAPDGIPSELLAEALTPINTRLLNSASVAEWPIATIHDDMRITYGLRDYAMISESEKWRVDAMIAEAVSHISGLKLLVLDRFDVLDLKGREDLLYWLDGMAQDGEIDSALIFGTLKALPALSFENIDAFWIENGTTNQLKEAA